MQQWGPVTLGDVKVGDALRVKLDAYEGNLGDTHNARRGRVVACRGGYVIMAYNDRSMMDAHHKPDKLERPYDDGVRSPAYPDAKR